MFDGIELRWSNFAPPETAAYAALPGLLLLRRSYFFVAWDELADGIVVGINLKAKMTADGVAHNLIVGRWFINVHVQNFFASSSGIGA